MILFSSDWQKYPGVIVDYYTPNKSFVKMAKVLHEMGVKNCLFMLALHNPELQGVDPFDEENLTNEQKLAIFVEAKYNPWYFFRELVRIPPKAGNAIIRFELNRASLALYWLFFNHIDVFLIMLRQVGKGLILDANIRVPGGWKRNGDLQVGDEVIAADGSTTEVVGVYPQGMKPVYEFTFSDGRKVRADDTHLWQVWDPSRGRGGKWVVLSTLECIERQEHLKSQKQRLSVPLVQPEHTEDRDLIIHPYVLGALIGDGGFTRNLVSFSNVDDDVIARVASLLPAGHGFSATRAGKDRNIIRTNPRDKYAYRETQDMEYAYIGTMLDSLGLGGKYGHEKFIPKEYLEGSHAQRMELLRGLLDTDGTIGLNNAITYDTSSEQLAEDVVYLVRSIGGMAYVAPRSTAYVYKGEKLSGRTSYRVRIRYSHPWELFHNERRRVRAKTAMRNLKFNSKLSIRSIERVEDMETQCIEVAHQDHLYVTDGFTVTHNTIGMAALVQGCLRFWMENSMIGQVTKDTALKLETIDAIKEIGNRLPSYLVDVDKNLDNPDSKTGIYYAALGNEFKSMVGRNDRKAANNVFRGSTPPMVWFDEPPFIPFIGITVPAVLGAMGTVVEEAERNNQPFGRVFTTTPGNIDDRDGGFIYRLVMESCKWTELMYDALNLDDLKTMVSRGCSNEDILSVNCTFTHDQLGKSDEWLRRKIAESRGTKEQADKDYRVIWASGGADSPLTVEQTDAIRDSEMEPTQVIITKDRYQFRWYDDRIDHEAQMAAGNYVLGIDTSEAVGRDAIAMVLTNVRDLAVVGTATINDTNLTRYAIWLCDFLIQYPKITAIVERKSTGTGIMDHLLYVMQSKGIDPFKRLYNRLVDDQTLRKDEYREVMNTPLVRRDTYFYDKFRRDFGFVTDRKRRLELYKDVLMEAVKRGARKVRDKTLASEIRGLVIRKGRVDHDEGKHDDHVIAWLMTAWFLLISKHHSVYGIPNVVFADVNETGGDVNEDDRERGMMLDAIQEELETLFAKLRTMDNPYASVQLEQRIRLLNAKLVQSGGQANNIDGMIQEAMAERTRKHLNNRAAGVAARNYGMIGY